MLSSFLSRTRDLIWWLIPLTTLATVLGMETGWGRAAAQASPSPLPAAQTQVAGALLPEYGIEGGVEARRETLERTLFNPTRRPAPVPAQEAAKPVMPRGQFALTGTTVAEGKSTAFLREVNGGRSRRVREGDTLNGMLVAEVKADRVKLTMGGESEELALKVVANSKPTPVPLALPGAAIAAPQAAEAGANTTDPAAAQQTLVERRRAARAAAAAREQAGDVAVPGAAPVPTPPVVLPMPAPVQSGQPASGFADVFRRYQQRSSNAGGTK